MATLPRSWILGAVAAAALTPAAAFAQQLSDTRIAFQTDRDGNPEIYLMRHDGLEQESITDTLTDERGPTWSPDGSHIAFATDRDGALEVYAMMAEAGALATNLTDRAGHDHRASWSPVGDKIAFTAEGDGNREIYVMNANGTGQDNITEHGALDQSPAWSPDGTRIAFMSGRSGGQAIHTMNADGTDEEQLTFIGGEVGGPAWSPDGTQIAYFSRQTGYFEIFTMNADGSDQTQRTFDNADVRRPTWAPDGSRLAFSSNRDDPSNYDIYTMDPDGANIDRITTDPARELDPAWSPFLPPEGPPVVAVDVKPGSHRNPINPRSRGVTPVAILSTQVAAGDDVDFDATTVDVATVMLGPDGAAPERSAIEDVDDDGDADLLLHVRTQALGVMAGDDILCLVGATTDGTEIEGCDTIATVPKRGKGAPARQTFAVGQNFPNPFNPETWIPFAIAEPANVTVGIYDMRGSLVRRLDLGHRGAGAYAVRSGAAYWDGRNDVGEELPSGLYIYRLNAGSETASRRMIIAR
jgi:dipeptidyl aminopeptidase/acylaminoacyl peptidase